MIYNIFLQLLTAIFYLFACLSLGVFILKKFENRSTSFSHPALVFLSLSFILGAGIISSVWLLLALGGLFRLRFILPILGICAILGLPYMKQLVTRAMAQLKNIWAETRTYSWTWQGIAVLSSLLLLLGLFSMTNWAGDAVAFYLAVPKVVAHTGRLSLLPGYEGFMSVGLQAEMHSAFFLKFGEPIFSKLFSGFSSFATAIILMGIGGKSGLKRKGKWLILTAYVTSSAIFMIIGDGKADMIAASIGIAAYYLALTDGPVSLIGILCGLAGTMKLSYIVTMFPGIAFLVTWRQINNNGWVLNERAGKVQLLGAILIKGVHIGGWCLLSALPHFIKNGLLLDAPIAPIGASGIGWLDQSWFGPETTRRLLLMYPISLTWGSFWAQAGNLSPLLLAFFPLNIFLQKPKKWLKSPLVAITLAGIIGMGCWFLRFPDVLAPRYYLATLLIFFPVCIRGAEYIIINDVKPKMLKFFSMSCVLAILISVGITSSRNYYKLSLFPKYFKGLTTTCDWDWSPATGFCAAHNEINRDAPPGARVFLASWYRYWLRPDLLQCTNGASDYINASGNPGDIWIQLYERGFEYLLLDGSLPVFDPQPQSLPDWISAERLTPPGHTIATYRLEFTQPPPEAEVKVTCQRKVGSAEWELVNN